MVTASPGARPAQPSSNGPFREGQRGGPPSSHAHKVSLRPGGGPTPGKSEGHLPPPQAWSPHRGLRGDGALVPRRGQATQAPAGTRVPSTAATRRRASPQDSRAAPHGQCRGRACPPH